MREIGHSDDVILRPTSTGMYYAKSMFKLSSPLDVLKFSPLGFFDRIRLGMVVVKARAVKDWMTLEGRTARDWLISMCGETVYRVVWEPLLVGKFGPFADKVSAVWFWKKIALRGGSRSSDGREVLAYYKEASQPWPTPSARRSARRAAGSSCGRASSASTSWTAACAPWRRPEVACPSMPFWPRRPCRISRTSWKGPFLRTISRSSAASATSPTSAWSWVLDRSLSSTYWLNVGDPDFPFVGVIEHTNFEPPESYGGKHIVYLSKYLPESDALYRMSDDELLAFALPHIRKMFPKFDPSLDFGTSRVAGRARAAHHGDALFQAHAGNGNTAEERLHLHHGAGLSRGPRNQLCHP